MGNSRVNSIDKNVVLDFEKLSYFNRLTKHVDFKTIFYF